MSAELDNLTTEVSEATSVMTSAIVLLEGLHDALIAAGTDPVKLAELAASLDSKTNELASAVVANTP
jgi:hypothetical protein